jgi:hypothetical protein
MRDLIKPPKHEQSTHPCFVMCAKELVDCWQSMHHQPGVPKALVLIWLGDKFCLCRRFTTVCSVYGEGGGVVPVMAGENTIVIGKLENVLTYHSRNEQ